MAVKTSNSDWLDRARVLATLAVVLLHVSSQVVLDAPPMSLEWWVGNVLDSAMRWSVSVFVMISGYLLLDPAKKEGYRAFYRKRASRILVPLVFWSGFYWGIHLLRTFLQGEPLSPEVQEILTGKSVGHLWFLYMIISLYLFTPIARSLLAALAPPRAAALCVALFVAAAAIPVLKSFAGAQPFFLENFVQFLPYFIVGRLLGQAQIRINPWAARALFVLAILATAFGCFALTTRSGLDRGPYFYDYLSLSVIPMSLSCFYLLSRLGFKPEAAPGWKKISALTFGIYLIHPAFIYLIKEAGLHVGVFNPILTIPLIAIVAFALSLVAAFVISKVPGLRRSI